MWGKLSLRSRAAAKAQAEPQAQVRVASPEVEVDNRPLQERVRDVGRRILSDVKGGKVKLPMLPAVATQALGLAGNPDASFREINRVIGNDAVISAKVIAAANSAIYNTGTPVVSLLAALNRLGMGTLRDILYQAVAEAHFFHGLRADEVAKQREHAVEVAHAVRIVANQIRLNTEYPFLCGLLHDIGRTFLSGFFERHPPRELTEAERPSVIDAFHPIIGEQVIKLWKLPDVVAEAARAHHRYRDPSYPDGYSQMGNVVAAAQRLLVRPIEAEPSAEDECLFDLGLSNEQIVSAQQMVERMRAAIGPKA